jgi:hypothetical protein
MPGSVAPNASQETCTQCEMGKFQSEEGRTACVRCTPGYYCGSGAAAALPCPGGTHKNALLYVMTSVDQCVTCPRGTFCSVGSTMATPCAPGTFNPNASATTCTRCAPGTFQSAEGRKTCVICTPGFYCRIGAAEPAPCPAGHVGNATGMYSSIQCTPVPVHYWAPLGSSIAETCPLACIALVHYMMTCMAVQSRSSCQRGAQL